MIVLLLKITKSISVPLTLDGTHKHTIDQTALAGQAVFCSLQITASAGDYPFPVLYSAVDAGPDFPNGPFDQDSAGLGSQLQAVQYPYKSLQLKSTISFKLTKLPQASKMTGTVQAVLEIQYLAAGRCSKFCQGACQQGRCICSSNQYGVHCHIAVEKVSFNSYWYRVILTKSSNSITSKIFYFGYPDITSEMLIEIQSGKAFVNVFANYGPSNKTFMMANIVNNIFERTSYQSTATSVNIKDAKEDYLLFLTLSQVNPDSTAQLSVRFTKVNSNSSWIYVIITVVTMMSISIVIITIYRAIRLKECCKSKPNVPSILNFFPTASKATLEQLQVTKAEGLDCSICLQVFKEDSLIKVLFCTHVFHESCLNEWLQRNLNCPYCRLDLSPQSCSSMDTILKESCTDSSDQERLKAIFRESAKLTAAIKTRAS